MSELRFFSIAAAFGDVDTGRVEVLLSGTWVAPNAEAATAHFVAKYYSDGNKRLTLLGVSCTAVAEATLSSVLEAIQQADEAAAETKLALVPLPATTMIPMPALDSAATSIQQAGLRQSPNVPGSHEMIGQYRQGGLGQTYNGPEAPGPGRPQDPQWIPAQDPNEGSKNF